MVKNFLFLCSIFIGFSCANTFNSTHAAVNLEVNECFDKFESETRICLDSIFNDSRCPTELVCVWEGDAIAAFTLTMNKRDRSFNLHVNDKFQNDTLIEGVSIKLLNIFPYPKTDQPIGSNDYRAEISVTEN